MLCAGGNAPRKYRILIVAGLLSMASQAGAETVCVTCSKPNLNIRCEIRKSRTIETLPFGSELLNKACVMTVKTSFGATGCRSLKETTCSNWPVKSFSLKEAKRAILGETPVASTSDSQKLTPQVPAAVSPATNAAPTPYNTLSTAWQKFLAIFTWH